MRRLLYFLLFGLTWLADAQTTEPSPENATTAVVRAFDNHNIVMFGEEHGCKQEYAWLRDLVATLEFADRVDDIVVEFGNSLYQAIVDRYIAGGDVPFSEVQQAWRNVIGATGAPSPVYESFYKAVREANLRRPGRHHMRIVLGDPPGDWSKITNHEELKPFALDRDACYARQAKTEVLAKGRRAFLIMGGAHFERMAGRKPDLGLVERELRAAGASTWLIAFNTRIYDDPRKRFAIWPLPSIVRLSGNWVGALPLFDEGFPGKSPAQAEAADALLFLAHSRENLTVLRVPRSELEGTAYGKELDRRMMIISGRHLVMPESEEPLGR